MLLLPWIGKANHRTVLRVPGKLLYFRFPIDGLCTDRKKVWCV